MDLATINPLELIFKLGILSVNGLIICFMTFGFVRVCYEIFYFFFHDL